MSDERAVQSWLNSLVIDSLSADGGKEPIALIRAARVRRRLGIPAPVAEDEAASLERAVDEYWHSRPSPALSPSELAAVVSADAWWPAQQPGRGGAHALRELQGLGLAGADEIGIVPHRLFGAAAAIDGTNAAWFAARRGDLGFATWWSATTDPSGQVLPAPGATAADFPPCARRTIWLRADRDWEAAEGGAARYLRAILQGACRPADAMTSASPGRTDPVSPPTPHGADSAAVQHGIRALLRFDDGELEDLLVPTIIGTTVKPAVVVAAVLSGPEASRGDIVATLPAAGPEMSRLAALCSSPPEFDWAADFADSDDELDEDDVGINRGVGEAYGEVWSPRDPFSVSGDDAARDKPGFVDGREPDSQA